MPDCTESHPEYPDLACLGNGDKMCVNLHRARRPNDDGTTTVLTWPAPAAPTKTPTSHLTSMAQAVPPEDRVGRPVVDPAEGARLAADGARRAGENAHEEWKRIAMGVLREVAERQEMLTTDDIWIPMETTYVDVETHEPRAMGAIINAGVRQGWIERLDETTRSVRPKSHKSVLFFYRSLIYAPVASAGLLNFD